MLNQLTQVSAGRGEEKPAETFAKGGDNLSIDEGVYSSASP